jgi:hypothetical protein
LKEIRNSMKSRIAAVLALALALSTGAAFAKTTKAQNSNTSAPTTNSGGMKSSKKSRKHRKARKHRRSSKKAATANANK